MKMNRKDRSIRYLRATCADLCHLAHDSADPDQRQRGVSVGDQPAHAAAQRAAEPSRKEQQKTINSLRSKKASVVDQKAALDKENDLAQQEIELVSRSRPTTSRSRDKGVELEAAKLGGRAQTVASAAACATFEESNGQMSYIAILLEATSLSDLPAWTWSARSLHIINRYRPT